MTNKYTICAFVTSIQIKIIIIPRRPAELSKVKLRNKKFIRVTLIILSENVVSLIRCYNLRKEK